MTGVWLLVALLLLAVCLVAVALLAPLADRDNLDDELTRVEAGRRRR